MKNFDNFKENERNLLFGVSFLNAMVKSADDEAKLKAVGRNGGPSNPSYRRKTSDLRRIIILPTARGVATKIHGPQKQVGRLFPPFVIAPINFKPSGCG